MLRLESMGNNKIVSHAFHRPWKSMKPISTFPRLGGGHNIISPLKKQKQKQKEPSPHPPLWRSFRLILRFEKTHPVLGGPLTS